MTSHKDPLEGHITINESYELANSNPIVYAMFCVRCDERACRVYNGNSLCEPHLTEARGLSELTGQSNE